MSTRVPPSSRAASAYCRLRDHLARYYRVMPGMGGMGGMGFSCPVCGGRGMLCAPCATDPYDEASVGRPVYDPLTLP